MIALEHTSCPSRRCRLSSDRSPSAGAALRPRRGVALVFVLVFVIAMAALAMSSIFMASNANLLAKSYDRDRDLRYAAEAALAIGKSRVSTDQNYLTNIPSGQLYRTLSPTPMVITGADGKTLDGITVQVYAGQTGSASGQDGRFASIVAVAKDQKNNTYIRRLELTQESFAKFAYWTNSETNSGTTIFFNNGDELWGPVWSNDVISIASGGATFHDNVGTVKTISGKSYAVFVKPPQENQKPIPLPTTTTLSNLPSYSSGAGWTFTNGDAAGSDERLVRDRVEFVAFDVDKQDDSTSDNEGFFRYYQANQNNERFMRGDWNPASVNNLKIDDIKQCGDWHYMPKTTPADVSRLKFYPASVHPTTWFRAQVESAYVERNSWPGFTSAHAKALADSAESLPTVLKNPNARCYLAGDPHLVATDRPLGGPKAAPEVGVYVAKEINKGGEDTTFTPLGKYGSWKAVTQTAENDTIHVLRPWDGRYLFGISRLYTPGAKGVIYFPGNVGVSGVVNGLVTLYAHGTIVILDDLRYANDPVKSRCHDILGMISDLDVVIADNALNTPQDIDPTNTLTYANLDDTKDLYLHSVIMSLGSSFRAQNYDQGPTDVNDCDGVNNGRGCIFLSGGLIQKQRGAVGTGGGTGFVKRYTYDHCAVVKPPPYFPTTGRFQDNRYIELDPVGFEPTTYFKSITPDP
jgi:Tfp pilus assembly protein PilX